MLTCAVSLMISQRNDLVGDILIAQSGSGSPGTAPNSRVRMPPSRLRGEARVQIRARRGSTTMGMDALPIAKSTTLSGRKIFGFSAPDCRESAITVRLCSRRCGRVISLRRRASTGSSVPIPASPPSHDGRSKRGSDRMCELIRSDRVVSAEYSLSNTVMSSTSSSLLRACAKTAAVNAPVDVPT